MREYVGWRDIITRYGMPESIETTYIQASMLTAVVNKLGGLDNGRPLTFADILPRYGGTNKRKFTDTSGKEIAPSDPLAGMILKGDDDGEEA